MQHAISPLPSIKQWLLEKPHRKTLSVLITLIMGSQNTGWLTERLNQVSVLVLAEPKQETWKELTFLFLIACPPNKNHLTHLRRRH